MQAFRTAIGHSRGFESCYKGTVEAFSGSGSSKELPIPWQRCGGSPEPCCLVDLSLNPLLLYVNLSNIISLPVVNYLICKMGPKLFLNSSSWGKSNEIGKDKRSHAKLIRWQPYPDNKSLCAPLSCPCLQLSSI